jgi:Tol biopolymer transport system component
MPLHRLLLQIRRASLLLVGACLIAAAGSWLPGCGGGGTGGPDASPASMGKIVFASDRDGDSEIYIMNPDGSQQLRLTRNPATDTRPSLSQDRRRVVFESDRDDLKVARTRQASRSQLKPRHTPSDANIFSINITAPGEPESSITQLTTSDKDFAPVLSRDGTRIVFRSTRDGDSEIYVMQANGSGQTRLTHDPADDRDPDLSPDGSKIVFASNRGGPSFIYNLYVMNIDGSGVERLTANASADLGPVWSPDGSKIAFWSNRDINGELYVINARLNADGSQPTPARLTHSPANDRFPTWSPDGRKLAFFSDRGGLNDIYVLDVASLATERLTHNIAEEDFPDWR